jgi:Cd2+/Zn2+-exporting ATPase
MVTEEYILENLCCANCAAKIEEQISKLNGVSKVRLNFIKKTLSVDIKTNQTLEKPIRRIIKSIEPDISIFTSVQAKTKDEAKLPLSLITACLGVLILLFTTLSHLSAEVKTYMLLTAYLLSSWKVLYNALVKIAHLNFLDEHFLMSIASIGAIYLKEYPEAIAVMVLYEIGQYFENKAVNRSRASIQNMLNLKPDLVHRLINDKVSDVLIEDIRAGELIAILPGERVPLDGEVVSGQSSLDTSALTGETLPQNVDVGHKIISGAMNLTGRITVKVSSTDADSTVTRILKLVETAAQRKSKSERFVTRFAKKYTPSVVLAAIFIALIPNVIFQQDFNIWFERALIFLIISCPCALVISIPLTNYAAIGAAARKGILLKGSNFMDALTRTKTFVYDKTGTLTTGKLEIQEVYPVEDVSEEHLARAALTCEENSSHPIALAIKQKYADTISIKPSLLHKEFHGKGIKAQTADATYHAGSQAFMKDMDIRFIPSEPLETCIFLAEGDVCLGFITFKDEIKPGFGEIIRKLKSKGIKNHIMLTGDHAFQAQKVSDELKLKKFYARLLPDEKLNELENIEQIYGSPVAFIGDGLNDAPVLSRAEIGIAMGAIGNPASIEAADIVLMQDEPQQLLDAVLMARKAKNIMWQNIIFAMGIKVIVMFLGTMGLANLWEAVICDVGVTLLAIGNAMRLLRN